MKRWIIIAAILVVAALVALYILGKRKASQTTETEPAGPPPPAQPPTATPPIGGISTTQLSDPDFGTGLAAIDRRIGEILASSKALEIQDGIRSQVNILSGVSHKKAGYYNQNLGAGLPSANAVPLMVDAQSKSAIAAFEGVDTSAGLATANALLNANRALFASANRCFVGQPELSNTDEFIRQVYCQGYVDCGKNYKDAMAGPNLLKGGQQAGEDMRRIAAAWLSAVSSFENEVRATAIQDLRNVGWKFIGFDQ